MRYNSTFHTNDRRMLTFYIPHSGFFLDEMGVFTYISTQIAQTSPIDMTILPHKGISPLK